MAELENTIEIVEDNVEGNLSNEERDITLYNSYIITLADGTEIICNNKNGSNYVSEKPVDVSIFKNNLSTMKVTYRGVEEVFTDMVFIQQMKWMDGTYYLAFRKKTQEEILLETLTKTSSDIIDLQLAFAEMYETMVLQGGS